MNRNPVLHVAALLLAVLGAFCLHACSSRIETPTGQSQPDAGWLFLGKGPYTLSTKVNALPGAASVVLIRDLSLMSGATDTLLSRQTVIGADGMLKLPLGKLDPGFYEVRLRDTLRWNIGVRPDAVASPPDARRDFDAFWQETLAELDQVPLEPRLTVIPAYSNELRTCYEVRYSSWGGAESGGILSVPSGEGPFPVFIQYMGYGAEPFYFDPSADPQRIDFLVSVRDQGISRAGRTAGSTAGSPPGSHSIIAGLSATHAGPWISRLRWIRRIRTASFLSVRARAVR